MQRNARISDQAVITGFRSALARRHVVPDEQQLVIAARLQRLFDELLAFKRARRSQLRKIFIRPPLPRGLYLYGGVGRGKSMLMNCFFDTLPFQRKRRVHFHAFMREVHERLNALRSENDPLLRVADEIAAQTRLLCFDEFHVSDIADAMILGRMLDALFERGVVIVLTTNYEPDGLYPNGLQRQNFLPTIEQIKRKLDVLELDSGVDYRLRALEQRPVFLVPANAEADRTLADRFVELAGGEGEMTPLVVFDRPIPVRRRALGVIWFDFDALCGGPRSQNDYLEIAQNHHSVLLSGIPAMTPAQASEARRLTWLVDIFYDHRVKLIATAAAEPDDLYTQGTQAGEFSRTASRLIEMRSHEYLAAQHGALAI
ncbi:MAG TPA: cell division protein ZapE [Rhodocyclaceae bacterium]